MKLILLSLLAWPSFSQNNLKLDYDVQVTETVFKEQGEVYRQYKYKDRTYEVKMYKPESTAQEIELRCWDTGNTNLKRQFEIKKRVTSKSSVFIEALRANCKDTLGGRKRVVLEGDLKIGFTFGDNRSSKLKNKSVFWNPLLSLVGFGAEWGAD